MSLNYAAFQALAQDLITNTFGGVSLTIRLLNNRTMTTVGVFKGGDDINIDSRGSATPIIGLTVQQVYVPGNLPWSPDVGGQIEFYVGSTKWVQRISKINTIQPTTTPILYILTVE